MATGTFQIVNATAPFRLCHWPASACSSLLITAPATSSVRSALLHYVFNFGLG